MKRLAAVRKLRKSTISIVGLLFVFFIISCSAKREIGVMESSKQRTHHFHALEHDGEMLLVGELSIDDKIYPVEMYYGQNTTVLVRKNPDQCIRFSANTYLFGFVPRETVSDSVTITPVDAQSYTVRKENGNIDRNNIDSDREHLEQERGESVESTVTISGEPQLTQDETMMRYRTMNCISEEEYVLHVN